jgi:hypothetical protein
MSSEVNGLRRADRVMGAGALALLILLFVKWYEVTIRLGSVHGLLVADENLTGWSAFTHARWVWLATIIVTLGAVALTLRGTKLELGVRTGSVVLGMGALSSALIVYRIAHHPVAHEQSRGARIVYAESLEIGIWLALVAALAITYGGYLAMRSEARVEHDHEEVGSASTPSPPTHAAQAGHDVDVDESASRRSEEPAERSSQAFGGLLAPGARKRSSAEPPSGSQR